MIITRTRQNKRFHSRSRSVDEGLLCVWKAKNLGICILMRSIQHLIHKYVVCFHAPFSATEPILPHAHTHEHKAKLHENPNNPEKMNFSCDVCGGNTNIQCLPRKLRRIESAMKWIAICFMRFTQLQRMWEFSFSFFAENNPSSGMLCSFFYIQSIIIQHVCVEQGKRWNV